MKDVEERGLSHKCSTVKVLDDEGVEQLQPMLDFDETTTAASGLYVTIHALLYTLADSSPCTHKMISVHIIMYLANVCILTQGRIANHRVNRHFSTYQVRTLH